MYKVLKLISSLSLARARVGTHHFDLNMPRKQGTLYKGCSLPKDRQCSKLDQPPSLKWVLIVSFQIDG